MKLQNIIFPNPRISNEVNLYYRVLGIPFERQNENDCLRFCKNHKINFDTYFNSFSLFKWYKYTNISNVKLKLILKGKFTVSLIHFYLKPGGKLEWKIIGEKELKVQILQRNFILIILLMFHLDCYHLDWNLSKMMECFLEDIITLILKRRIYAM